MTEQNVFRYFALFLLGITYLCALGLAIWWIVNKSVDTIPSYVTLIIGTGLSIAINYIGYHQGLYAGTAVSSSVVSSVSANNALNGVNRT